MSSSALLFSYARWDTWLRDAACTPKKRFWPSATNWKLRGAYGPSILPEPEGMPEISGLQGAAQYVLMSRVAADFYDFLVLIRKIAHRWGHLRPRLHRRCHVSGNHGPHAQK
jgi:hypothetical protein